MLTTTFDLLWLPVLLIMFWILGTIIAKSLGLPEKLASGLYWWHTLFSIIYYWIHLIKGGDAIAYFNAGRYPDWNFNVGTEFVRYISGILVSILGMGFFTTFIVFGFLGYLGLLLFAYVLLFHLPDNGVTDRNRKWVYIILFLPSLSFWSSALGKDSVALFACCLGIFAAADIAGRKGTFMIAVFIMYAVRPHVAVCMLVGIIAAMMMSSNINLFVRIFVLSVMGGAIVLLLPYVIHYVGLEAKFTGGEVADRVSMMHGFAYSGGSGGLDISTMSWPMRLFSYLFRPLFLDARNGEQLVTSFENMLLLFLFIRFSRVLVKVLFFKNILLLRYAFIYSVMALVILGNTNYNLGIAVRQKTMFLPALFVLLVYAIYAFDGWVASDDSAYRVVDE